MLNKKMEKIEREVKGRGKKMDGTTMGLNTPKISETLYSPFLF